MTINNKIGKYEYLTGEEILPSDQSRIIDDSKKWEEKIKREGLIYGQINVNMIFKNMKRDKIIW